jgi:DNA repair protein RadA/Sms
MAKVNSIYICQNCGSLHPKWSGQCEACKAWNRIEQDFATQKYKSSSQETL